MLTLLPAGPKMLRRNGVVPRMPRRFIPTQSRPQLISGVTRDLNGNPLAACTVKLYRTYDDSVHEVVTSDANGNYTFSAIVDGSNYYVVGYLPGSPDVAGTTVNTLVGV